MAAAESLVAAAPPPSPPGTIFPLELETKVVEVYAKFCNQGEGHYFLLVESAY